MVPERGIRVKWGKLRLFFLLWLAVNCSLPLFASDSAQAFNVGIIPLEAGVQTFSSLVSSRTSNFGTKLHPDSSVQKELAMQAMHKQLEDLKKQLANAYATFDEKQISTLQGKLNNATNEIPSIHPVFDVNYTLEKFDEDKAQAFALSDDALTWFANVQSYDALLLVWHQALDEVERVQVVWYLPLQHSRKTILDKVVVASSYRTLQDDLDDAIFSLVSNNEVGAVRIHDAPSGYSVSVDGVPMQGPVLFLSAGVHEFVFSEPNHEDKIMKLQVENGRIVLVQPDMLPLSNSPLFLASRSGSASWFANGISLGTAPYVSIEDPVFPLLLSLTKEGFASKTVQLSNKTEQQIVAMQPQALSSKSILQKGQRDFYKQLRNTILMFGISIGVSTLSKTYAAGSTFWQPALIATSSLTLVSSLATINELASYAALAQ